MTEHSGGEIVDEYAQEQLADLAIQFHASWCKDPDINVILRMVSRIEDEVRDPRMWGKVQTEFNGPEDAVRRLKALMERGGELLFDLRIDALNHLPAFGPLYAPCAHELWLHAMFVMFPRLPPSFLATQTLDSMHLVSTFVLDRVASYSEQFAVYAAKYTPGRKNDQTVKPDSPKASNRWPSEPPPEESRYKFGPLEGSLKLFAGCGRMDARTFQPNNGKSFFYIRKVAGKGFEVWFDSQKVYAKWNAEILNSGQ